VSHFQNLLDGDALAAGGDALNGDGHGPLKQSRSQREVEDLRIVGFADQARILNGPAELAENVRLAHEDARHSMMSRRCRIHEVRHRRRRSLGLPDGSTFGLDEPVEPTNVDAKLFCHGHEPLLVGKFSKRRELVDQLVVGLGRISIIASGRLLERRTSTRH
jgi:hypothetical protein